MADARIPVVPHDWTVWACSDVHGMTSSLAAALGEAGLVDERRRWVAPPRTALIGCGDYLDRGGDIAGTIGLLQRLSDEAASAGGAVILARGNHEVMPLMARDGSQLWLEEWLEYGGRATLRAFGCDPDQATDPERMASALDAAAPWLFAWLESRPHAVRWRDVVFVHAGLPVDHALDDLGVTTEDHLWIRAGFYERDWDDPGFDAYRAAGVNRVVFGHTPQLHGPTAFHDGHSLDIDTNAVGDPRHPVGARQALTIVEPGIEPGFGAARLISIPTDEAPEAMSR